MDSSREEKGRSVKIQVTLDISSPLSEEESKAQIVNFSDSLGSIKTNPIVSNNFHISNFISPKKKGKLTNIETTTKNTK
ncbi:MAG: hypothetical protein MJ252_08945, partial [archaeon]|nr:hypothetical protein [archaeon]